VADRPQLDVVRRRGCESRTVLGAATTLALNGTDAPPHACGGPPLQRCRAAAVLGSCVRVTAVVLRCRPCVTAVLAVRPCLPAGLHFRPTLPWPAVVVTRRLDSSTAPTGVAAQLVVPHCARGRAAVLCFLAVRLCKAPPYALVGSGWRPFISAIRTIVSSGASHLLVGSRADVGPRWCRITTELVMNRQPWPWSWSPVNRLVVVVVAG
jgi:hypothetical protein